jgi:CheY-like chemotaxis protein
MRVLVAESDERVRENLRQTVEELGHQAVVAGDGLEAWELYKSTPEVDVVLSEWRTSGIDGLELCRRIRAADPGGYTPFIFLSDPESEEQVATVVGAGADDYLAKPLDSERLQARLDAASRLTSPERPPSANGKVETNYAANGNGSSAPGDKSTTNGATNGAPSGALRRRSGFVSSKRPGTGSARFWNGLISEGRVSEEQIQRALEAQEDDARDLGKVMVSLGFITSSELARAQARHLRLDYIELTERDVDRDAVALVPERLLRKHMVLPRA